jgi:6-phosphogluconolactonase
VNGELQVVDDVPAAFAQRVIDAYEARENENFSIALSGGETARRCYERLAEVAAERIDWWKVQIYWGDERCVPSDSPESNERLVRESLLERVGAADAVYPMRCDEGPEDLGRFDVVHLGLGPDGHTASLFPESPALDADPGLLVVSNEDPLGNNPHKRMTLTFAGIARARLVLVTVEGDEKREAMQAVYDGRDVPAARVTADEVVWLVDPDAAPR